MQRKENPHALLVGMQTGAPTMEKCMEVPQKTKNGAALWPRDSTSGNISKETQKPILKEYTHSYVHYSIIYNRHDMEATPVSINWWMDNKSSGAYIQWNISHKKKILPFATAWMDLEDIMLSDISQTEKDKYHMISFICGI